MNRITLIGTLITLAVALALAGSAFALNAIDHPTLPEFFFVVLPLTGILALVLATILSLRASTGSYGVFAVAFALWAAAGFVLKRALDHDFHSLWSALPLAALVWTLILSLWFALAVLQRRAYQGSKCALLLQGVAALPALLGLFALCWTFSPTFQAIEGKVVSAAYLLFH